MTEHNDEFDRLPADQPADEHAEAGAPVEPAAEPVQPEAAPDYQRDSESELPAGSSDDAEASRGEDPAQTDTPSSEEAAASPSAQQTPREEQEDHPVGQVFGGENQVHRQPSTDQQFDVARETDPRDIGGLSYVKHGQEATDENGEQQPIVVAHPVRVDGRNRRSDDDALEGQKCDIVDGEYKGRKGVFWSVTRYDPASGYPVQVIVRSLDNENEFLSVAYSQIRPVKSVR